jgi:subtilase family serine protease
MGGGTSLSTPLWAGIVALYAQALAKNSQSLSTVLETASPTGGGFNALLYQAKTVMGTGVLHDVVTGSSDINSTACYSTCSSGAKYNQMTGLGTPDVSALITQLLTE